MKHRALTLAPSEAEAIERAKNFVTRAIEQNDLLGAVAVGVDGGGAQDLGRVSAGVILVLYVPVTVGALIGDKPPIHPPFFVRCVRQVRFQERLTVADITRRRLESWSQVDGDLDLLRRRLDRPLVDELVGVAGQVK